MSILLQKNENLELSTCVLVDKGKNAAGVQERDVRVSLVGHTAKPPQGNDTWHIVQDFAILVKTYIDSLSGPEDVAPTYDAFHKNVLETLNRNHSSKGYTFTRFFILGWEASVETLAEAFGIKLPPEHPLH